jgi:hypothetical protein
MVRVKRSTIFSDKAKSELVPNNYKKPTICRIHMDLAHKIDRCKLPRAERRDLLQLVDVVFDMGKRMDEKLSFYKKALISPEYKEQNILLHKRPGGFGGSGHRWAPHVQSLISEFKITSLLDYGCGEETLWKALNATDVQYTGYDPAVSGKTQMPGEAELVTCTDVLEHVEPDKVLAVVRHICCLTRKVAFFNIALHPSNKTLPDGRNAHLIIQPISWWIQTLFSVFQELEWNMRVIQSPRPEKDLLLALWKRN